MPIPTLAHEKGSDDEFSAMGPGVPAVMNRNDQNLIEEFNDEMLDADDSQNGDVELET